MHALKSLFQQTLDYIGANVYEVLNTEPMALEDYNESFGAYSSYGSYPFFYNVISMARDRGLVGYITKLITHLNKWSDINDLYGECYIKLSNFKDEKQRTPSADIIQWFGIVKLERSEHITATFKETTDSGWQCEISGLGPVNHIYRQAAYEYMVEFFAYAFNCEAKVVATYTA